MDTNYGEQLEKLINQQVYHFFEEIVERENLFPNYNRWELSVILRYHCRAVLGILQDFTEEDSKKLEDIVHLIFLLISGKISP